MSAVLFVIMALAAFRVWRLIGADHWPPSEWFRDQLEDKVSGWNAVANAPDEHLGAGAEFEGNRERLAEYRRAKAKRRHRSWETLQTLVLCPWCLGAYISAAVVSVATLFESVPVPVLQWLAVSAVVGLVAEAIDQ